MILHAASLCVIVEIIEFINWFILLDLSCIVTAKQRMTQPQTRSTILNWDSEGLFQLRKHEWQKYSEWGRYISAHPHIRLLLSEGNLTEPGPVELSSVLLHLLRGGTRVHPRPSRLPFKILTVATIMNNVNKWFQKQKWGSRFETNSLLHKWPIFFRQCHWLTATKGFCYTKQWARNKNRLCLRTQTQRGGGGGGESKREPKKKKKSWAVTINTPSSTNPEVNNQEIHNFTTHNPLRNPAYSLSSPLWVLSVLGGWGGGEGVRQRVELVFSDFVCVCVCVCIRHIPVGKSPKMCTFWQSCVIRCKLIWIHRWHLFFNASQSWACPGRCTDCWWRRWRWCSQSDATLCGGSSWWSPGCPRWCRLSGAFLQRHTPCVAWGQLGVCCSLLMPPGSRRAWCSGRTCGRSCCRRQSWSHWQEEEERKDQLPQSGDFQCLF